MFLEYPIPETEIANDFLKISFTKKLPPVPFSQGAPNNVFKKHAIKIIWGDFRMGIFGIFSDDSITYHHARKGKPENYLHETIRTGL